VEEQYKVRSPPLLKSWVAEQVPCTAPQYKVPVPAWCVFEARAPVNAVMAKTAIRKMLDFFTNWLMYLTGNEIAVSNV